MTSLKTLESELFDLISPGPRPPGAVFILGAPRTGSTLLYQAMCHQFRFPYIANLTNDQFPSTPIIGLAAQKSLPVDINLDSRFGKTRGPLQPSEGSGVMAGWFGGGHPSAIVSARALEGAETHLLKTLRAVEVLFGAPLMIKNAWNCFRVPYLAQALPAARFVWIRRNLNSAAKSDLAARYTTKASAHEWNSATPANLETLKRLPPSAQVVENQHEFNSAIGQGLRTHAADRWYEIWYEDFCQDAVSELERLGAFLDFKPIGRLPSIGSATSSGWNISEDDALAIDAYIVAQAERFAADLYPSSK
jgi:hypothetical protein